MSRLSARVQRLRQYAPNAHERRELIILAALLPFAWLPHAAGNWAMRRIASFQMREGRRYRREVDSRVPPAVLDTLGPSRSEAMTALETGLLADHFSRLVELAAPWRRPRVDVRGLERVTTALEDGKGAILWVQLCSGASVHVKRALAEHAHPLVHLSRPGHPFSDTPFGRRFVNPILRRPEVRALKERVEIPEAGSTGPLRRLRRALAANQVVSITVAQTASRVTGTPCLGGLLLLPTGPVELAWASGARLLPVFTFGAPWKPVVVIGEPLPVSGHDTKAVGQSHRVAAGWLEEMVLQHPDAWWGWRGGGWRPATEPALSGASQSLEQDITGS